MVSRVAVGLVAVALCWPSSQVHAEYSFSGDDYLHRCTSKDPNWKPHSSDEQDDAVFCVGYIEASVVMLSVMDKSFFCLPSGATGQDILKATFAFLQAHPEQGQYLFASTMVAAVEDRWPCRTK